MHTTVSVSQINSIRKAFRPQFSAVQSLSRVWAARQTSLSITNSWSLLKLMSIELVMPSSHLILCHPLLLPPSIFPSIRVFSNESVLHIRGPKYWSCSFNISPSNEYSGLISFRVDWLDLLAVQGTLRSLLQYHSSKASILHRSAFFMIQLSHPYMTSGKTTALTRWTLVGRADLAKSKCCWSVTQIMRIFSSSAFLLTTLPITLFFWVAGRQGCVFGDQEADTTCLQARFLAEVWLQVSASSLKAPMWSLGPDVWNELQGLAGGEAVRYMWGECVWCAKLRVCVWSVRCVRYSVKPESLWLKAYFVLKTLTEIF